MRRPGDQSQLLVRHESGSNLLEASSILHAGNATRTDQVEQVD